MLISVRQEESKEKGEIYYFGEINPLNNLRNGFGVEIQHWIDSSDDSDQLNDSEIKASSEKNWITICYWENGKKQGLGYQLKEFINEQSDESYLSEMKGGWVDDKKEEEWKIKKYKLIWSGSGNTRGWKIISSFTGKYKYDKWNGFGEETIYDPNAYPKMQYFAKWKGIKKDGFGILIHKNLNWVLLGRFKDNKLDGSVLKFDDENARVGEL